MRDLLPRFACRQGPDSRLATTKACTFRAGSGLKVRLATPRVTRVSTLAHGGTDPASRHSQIGCHKYISEDIDMSISLAGGIFLFVEMAEMTDPDQHFRSSVTSDAWYSIRKRWRRASHCHVAGA
jgi:hypothetical protein